MRRREEDGLALLAVTLVLGNALAAFRVKDENLSSSESQHEKSSVGSESRSGSADLAEHAELDALQLLAREGVADQRHARVKQHCHLVLLEENVAHLASLLKENVLELPARLLLAGVHLYLAERSAVLLIGAANCYDQSCVVEGGEKALGSTVKLQLSDRVGEVGTKVEESHRAIGLCDHEEIAARVALQVKHWMVACYFELFDQFVRIKRPEEDLKGREPCCNKHSRAVRAESRTSNALGLKEKSLAGFRC